MNQYRKHFDHLGQMRAGDLSHWSSADKAIALCLFITVIKLISEVL